MWKSKRLLVVFLGMVCVLAVSRTSQGQSVPSKVLAYPEMILHNGKVLTVDENFSAAQAVAIRDGRFLEVGTDQEVLPLRGPQTAVIDLKGRSVVPGFIDTHLHGAWRGNISKRGVRTLAFQTLEEGLAEIQEELVS